jgi:flagellum-specific peptidoglycan hydrolase FlgJ
MGSAGRNKRILLWAAGFIAFTVLTGKKVVKNLSAKKKFKDALAPIAQEVKALFNIHPDITILQAAHESNFGQSGLTVQANNLFGFTGEGWQKAGKPVILLDTKEYVNGKWTAVKRPFRSYPSWRDSVLDWANLIARTARYSKAYVEAQKGNVPEFAKAIAAAGYATDPKYADKLVALAPKVKEIGEAAA